jgi:hypothetical protein
LLGADRVGGSGGLVDAQLLELGAQKAHHLAVMVVFETRSWLMLFSRAASSA